MNHKKELLRGLWVDRQLACRTQVMFPMALLMRETWSFKRRLNLQDLPWIRGGLHFEF